MSVSTDRFKEWLDPEEIDNYDFISRENHQFELEVETRGKNQEQYIRIYRDHGQGPFRITGKYELDRKAKNIIMEYNEIRRHFFMHLSIILVKPDSYRYLDKNDEKCFMDDIEKIEIEDKIYQDEATQHKIMTSIISIDKCLNLLEQNIKILKQTI